MNRTDSEMRDKIIKDAHMNVPCKACNGSGTKHMPSGGTLVLIACSECHGSGEVKQGLRERLVDIREGINRNR